jgi:hypothetical protein
MKWRYFVYAMLIAWAILAAIPGSQAWWQCMLLGGSLGLFSGALANLEDRLDRVAPQTLPCEHCGLPYPTEMLPFHMQYRHSLDGT